MVLPVWNVFLLAYVIIIYQASGYSDAVRHIDYIERTSR